MTSSDLSPLGEAAQWYARHGFAVFPLRPERKRPLLMGGYKLATTDLDQIAAWWREYPQANIGIATGQVSGIVVIDVDPRNHGDISLDTLVAELGQPPDHLCVETAGGGKHYYVAHWPGAPSCKLRDGIDILSDGRYVVAPPSTVGGSSYTWIDPPERSDEWDAPVPPEPWRRIIEQRSERRTSPQIHDVIPAGQRNSTLTSMAGVMRHHGLSQAEILAALHVANDTRCAPPLPSSEIARIAASVARYAPDHDILAPMPQVSDEWASAAKIGASQAIYRLQRLSDLIASPAVPEWTVKGWLPRRGLAMLIGPSGAGKSILALDIAAAVAAGIDSVLGPATGPATVVYLAGEGHWGLRGRFAAWARDHQSVPADLWLSPRGASLDTRDGLSEVLQAIADIESPPALIVVDTLHRHMVGDENKAVDAAQLIRATGILSAQFDALVLLVHHTGVAAEAQMRARGSSAWRAANDTEIVLHPQSHGIVKVKSTKVKDGPAPEPIELMIHAADTGWTDDHGESVNAPILRPAPSIDPRLADVLEVLGQGLTAAAANAELASRWGVSRSRAKCLKRELMAQLGDDGQADQPPHDDR